MLNAIPLIKKEINAFSEVLKNSLMKKEIISPTSTGGKNDLKKTFFEFIFIFLGQ